MKKNYFTQNKKLKLDKIFTFSLPVIITCIKALACLAFCYAQKGYYKMFSKTIRKSHNENFELAKSKDFVKVICNELRKRKIKTCRIHSAGDFFSQVYLNRWYIIARHNKNIFFYAYTKSIHLNFKNFDKLKNTKVIQSFGGKLDNKINLKKPNARIFPNLEALLNAGYVDCSKSDKIAIKRNVVNVGLIAH